MKQIKAYIDSTHGSLNKHPKEKKGEEHSPALSAQLNAMNLAVEASSEESDAKVKTPLKHAQSEKVERKPRRHKKSKQIKVESSTA